MAMASIPPGASPPPRAPATTAAPTPVSDTKTSAATTASATQASTSNDGDRMQSRPKPRAPDSAAAPNASQPQPAQPGRTGVHLRRRVDIGVSLTGPSYAVRMARPTSAKKDAEARISASLRGQDIPPPIPSGEPLRIGPFTLRSGAAGTTADAGRSGIGAASLGIRGAKAGVVVAGSTDGSEVRVGATASGAPVVDGATAWVRLDDSDESDQGDEHE